jgi:hypothetical protein
MVRSGSGVIVVGSFAVLSFGLTSPPPLTVTTFVTEAGAFGATFTVMVTGGY